MLCRIVVVLSRQAEDAAAQFECCIALAGKQAEVLNILLEDLLEGHAVSETKLKEVLGHTPIQVIMLQVVCPPYIISP